jgi:alpha-L-fucosidase
MTEKKTTMKDRLKWFKDARFGMFIHWGVYALPAGVWKGKAYPQIGEWIKESAQIPDEEYDRLATKFNPDQFDADAIVKLAKEAGMKYLVFTAKHADGFAMYDSKCSDYSIVRATPYRKDPVKALAAACKREKIRLCFYYSQAVDLHEEGAAKKWTATDLEPASFHRYIERKVKPQLQELLTQYGPIGLIWFDNPCNMTKKESLDLKRWVLKFQPDCLVSGRIGNGVADYESLGDNQLPAGRIEGAWETPATLNDTWGYKKDDRHWKSSADLIRAIVDLSSRGVNYLLNIGPTGIGVVPTQSVKRLKEIGRWMSVNGESIYGTTGSPFPCDFDWGRITVKGKKMFLHFYQWPRKTFTLYGLESSVRCIKLLADLASPIAFRQWVDNAKELHVLEIDLPKKRFDKVASVVVLELKDCLAVDETLMQQPDGAIHLPPHLATIRGPKKDKPVIVPGGVVAGWKSIQHSLGWKFRLYEPGEYEVRLSTKSLVHEGPWQGGHRVSVRVGGQTLSRIVEADELSTKSDARYYAEAITVLGRVKFDAMGMKNLEFSADALVSKLGGLVVSGFELKSLKS